MAQKRVIMKLELNIDKEIVEECMVYEGDTVEALVKRMANKHKLSQEERNSLTTQLQQYF